MGRPRLCLASRLATASALGRGRPDQLSGRTFASWVGGSPAGMCPDRTPVPAAAALDSVNMGPGLGPLIQYAKSGEINIAYLAVGDRPLDIVIVPRYVSHLEIGFENPGIRRMSERIAKFARVIIFDKRGTGMSDPVDAPPQLEQRMDEVRPVRA